MTPLRLFLHTYSFRFRLTLDPDYSIVDLLDRAVAEGAPGIGLNVNGPGYRFLGGDDPEHIAMVADAIRNRGLDVDIETTMERDVVERLRAMGHVMAPVADPYMDFGSGQFIWRLTDAFEDGYVAASDSRRDGQAVGY